MENLSIRNINNIGNYIEDNIELIEDELKSKNFNLSKKYSGTKTLL